MHWICITLLVFGGASAFFDIFSWSKNNASCASEDEQLELFLECVKQSDKSNLSFVKQVLLKRKVYLKELKNNTRKIESLLNDVSSVNKTVAENTLKQGNALQRIAQSCQDIGKSSNESLMQLNNSHELKLHSIQANVTRTFEELGSINRTLSYEMDALNDTANQLRANLLDAYKELEKLRVEFGTSQGITQTSLQDINSRISETRQDITKCEQRTGAVRATFDARVNEVNREINNLKVAKTDMQSDFDRTKNTVVAMNEKATQLESTLFKVNISIETKTASVSDTFTEEINIVKNDLKNLKDGHNALKLEFDGFKKTMSERHKSFDERILKIDHSVVELSNKQRQSETEITANRNAIHSLSNDLRTTKTSLGQTHEQLDKLRNEYDSTKAILDVKIDELRAFKEQHHKDTEHAKAEINTLRQQLEQNSDSLQDNIDTLGKKNDDSDNDIKSMIEKGNTLFTEFKTEYNEQFKSTKLALKQLRNDDTAIRKSLDSASETLDHADKELSTQVETARRGLQILIDEAKQQFKEDLAEQRNKVNIILPNTFNKESVTLAAVIIITIVIGNTVTIYVLFTRKASNTVGSHRNEGEVPGRLDMSRSQRNTSVLDQLPSQPELTSSVCVISFDGEAQDHHRRLVADGLPASLQTGNSILYHVVRQHHQILDMPYSKVFLMFVEFSERHVIIEERGLGLGDLKRTTYEAIMKLGGCLVIVYVRDPGSRRLPATQLYNHDIDCVSSQPELSSLDQSGRFFSVYDTLTPYQKKQLGSMVHKHLT